MIESTRQASSVSGASENWTFSHLLSPGDVVHGHKLLGQMQVASGESDLWLAESPEGKRVVKFYRHGVIPLAMPAVAHPNLMPVIARGLHEDRHYEITPLMKGSLQDCLKIKPLQEADLYRLLEQLLGAVHVLHERGVQHRDIKPSNILMDENGGFFLSDLGSAGLSSNTCLTCPRNTLLYSAPEAITGIYSKASDWWSVGMVLLESVLGQHPLQHLSGSSLFLRLSTGQVDIPSLPGNWGQIVHGLLEPDHTKRWNESTIRQWIAGTLPKTSRRFPGAQLFGLLALVLPVMIRFTPLAFLAACICAGLSGYFVFRASRTCP